MLLLWRQLMGLDLLIFFLHLYGDKTRHERFRIACIGIGLWIGVGRVVMNYYGTFVLFLQGFYQNCGIYFSDVP